MTRVLIYSPDTDVYNIGLALLQASSEIIVQINVPHSKDFKYVHLNNLVQALDSDPDLATLPRSSLPSTFQMLFVCTGCDYILFPFSKGLEKHHSSMHSTSMLLLSVVTGYQVSCLTME